MSQTPIGAGGVFGEDSSRAPDLINAVVGFRIFNVGTIRSRFRGPHDALLSTFLGTPWEPGWNRAKCKWHTYVELMANQNLEEHPERPPIHEAPHQFCACGFYAWHNPSKSKSCAHAIVELKGRIQVHKSGMRAQHARVCALAAPDSLKGQEMQPRLHEIARRWGVPYFPVSQLCMHAGDFGEGLPDAFRP